MENPYLVELTYYLRNAYPPFVYQLNPEPVKDYIPVFIFHKVTEKEFEEKLIFLKENNYHTITTRELYSFIKGDFIPKSPTIHLTFDDGHKSIYEIAFPLLKRYGFCITIFIVPTYMDKPNWLTWEQVDEMNKSGLIDIQSHTLEHKKISKMQASAIFCSLTQSKKILEERLNKPIQHLAYPFGRGSSLAQTLSRKAGFLTNFWGSLIGHPYNTKGTDPYRLARLKEDYIFRLPGIGRKSLREIFAIKLRRRKKAKEQGVDIYT